MENRNPNGFLFFLGGICVDYILLLRGVNVGGNRKISMTELKEQLIIQGFENVSSYINSGNLLISSALEKQACIDALQSLFKSHFFELDFVLLDTVQYKKMLELAPSWWGENEEWRHNLAFVLAPYTAEDLRALSAQINSEYEHCKVCGNAIFWSSSFTTHYSKTMWSKLMKQAIYRHLTVRNRNTALKLRELIERN